METLAILPIGGAFGYYNGRGAFDHIDRSAFFKIESQTLRLINEGKLANPFAPGIKRKCQVSQEFHKKIRANTFSIVSRRTHQVPQ
jgi:hypothetical protein